MPSKSILRSCSRSALLLLAGAALTATSCTLEPEEVAEAGSPGAPTLASAGQAGTSELDASGGDSPITPAANDTFHNWYTGTRGNEHGYSEQFGDCPNDAMVVGVQYFEGGNSDWVDNIGVACWGPTSGYRFWNWWSPGAPRTAEQGTHGSGLGLCPWGMFVSGLQYFGGGSVGDGVDGIGVRCSNATFTATTLNNWYPNQPSGEQGNFIPNLGACPGNTFVLGVQAFEGIGGQLDWMDAIGMHCGTRP